MLEIMSLSLPPLSHSINEVKIFYENTNVYEATRIILTPGQQCIGYFRRPLHYLRDFVRGTQ